MDRDAGSKDSSIWLLGDSDPPKSADRLDYPLDPRHPTRHNIWTPILEGIQGCVFRSDRRRVDANRFYIRNAVQDPADRPNPTSKVWTASLDQEISCFSELIETYRPKIVFTLGGFAFEFARRSIQKDPNRATTYWSAERLGVEFCSRIEGFNIQCINIVSLLHVSIDRGKFLECHRNFTGTEDGNYFRYTACKISELLLVHEADLDDIWVSQQ